nr:histidine kinase dimerization/phospho-acceptor domain-containing protein [Neisseria weixii]
MPQNHPIPRTLLVTRCPFEKNTQMLISQDISTVEHVQASHTSFIANVSHELRTPLTVINGFLETMRDMPDIPDEQRRQFISLMQKEGSRMLDLLNDLLTLSRRQSTNQPQTGRRAPRPLQRQRHRPRHRPRTHPASDRALLPRRQQPITPKRRYRLRSRHRQTCLGRA